MSQSRLYVSLDIGSSSIKVLIGEADAKNLHVIGVGNVHSKGIRKGTIIDIDATVASIQKAVEQAERMAGMEIQEVILGIPSNGVQLLNVKGVVAINSENREITDDELYNVMESAQVTSIAPDQEIVNLVPRQFIVDDYDEITDPRGMIGVRLEMDGTLITAPKTVVHNILRCVERAGLTIREIYLQPLAAGTFALSEDEKNHGTAFIDIGGGSTTITYFENDQLMSTNVLPIGGDHVTKDLSIVLKTPTKQARKIKHQYGHAFFDDTSEEQLFEVPIIGTDSKEQVSERYIAEIIGVRLEELFELVIDGFYRMGIKDLPGGVVLTGGITKLDGILPLARHVLQTRVRIHTPAYIGVREPMYATAVGLIQYAQSQDDFFGTTSDTSAVQAYEHPGESRKETTGKSAQKEGFFNKVKKHFNNYFD